MCGILVFFLFGLFGTMELNSPGSGNGYAVLAVEESRSDRHVRESLMSLGLGGIISESTQEIPVDDFGVLKMIPLETYHNEIETFDPRDNGYAAQVRSFFIQDGNRLFFIPADKINGIRIEKLKKQLAPLLGDLRFSLALLGQKRNPLLHLALLAAACAGVLYLSRSRRLFIFGLPVLLAFYRIGFSSFVLAAIMTGIWELLREPLGELSAVRYHARPFDYVGSGFNGLLKRLKPFRLNLFLILVFAVFFVLVSIVAALPPFPLAAGCLSFFFLYKLALWTEARRIRENRHIPFTPVLMLPLRVRTFSLVPLLLPFAAVSLLALFLSMLFPAFSGSIEKDQVIDPASFVSLEDYERHVGFQNSFSYRPVGQEPGMGMYKDDEYLRYYLGEDGLIAGSTDDSAKGEGDIPPFPLEKLMDFLVNYYKSGAERDPLPGTSLINIKEWISVLILFSCCLLDLLQGGLRGNRRKKLPVFDDRRIAA